MSNTLSKVLIFVAGAAVGSVVTWKLVEAKYKKIADEEIASVKEVFGMTHAEEKDEEPVEVEEDDIPEEQTIEQARVILKENGYTNYALTPEEVEQKMKDVERPYVIPPEEYGELYDYDTIELTYYVEDGVLADDGNEPIDNIDEVVGYDSLRKFGEYEDDAVHVRNDVMKVDYEILLSIERYEDVVSVGPRGTED